jgi:hypothetical protein
MVMFMVSGIQGSWIEGGAVVVQFKLHDLHDALAGFGSLL